MSLFSPYFPLESNAYRVGKSGQLRRQMGTAGFGLYVMVLSHLRDCPDCTAELDYDALGYELHEDPALVRRVVEDFGLFLLDREHGTFTAEALREVAAAGRPRARSKRNNAERHRRERKSSRRTTDTDDVLPDETEEEEVDLIDTLSDATTQDDAPTADAAVADDSAQPKNVRTVAERKEENKKPSPPIVPLPQRVSGKGETPQNARWEEEAQSRRSAVAVSLPPPSARGDESNLTEANEKLPQVGKNSLDVEEDDERTERNRRPTHWTRERFVAPNATEVAAYAHFLGRPRFDAQRFVLYYESRGWLLQGGLAVADWRSLVKLWLVRGDAQRRGAQGEPQTTYAAQTGGFSGRNAPKSPISSTDGSKTSSSFPSAAGVRQPTRTTSVQQRREDDLARWASTLLGVTPDALSAGSTSFAAPSSPDRPAAFETSASPSPQLFLGAGESERSFAYADEDTTDYQAFAGKNTAPDDALSAHVAEQEDAPAPEGAKGEAEVRLTGETSDRQPTENNPLDTEALPEMGSVSAHENTLLFTFNTHTHVSRKQLEPLPVAHGEKRSPVPDGRSHVHPLPLADESSPTDDAAERRRSAAERRECTTCLHEYRAGCVPF